MADDLGASPREVHDAADAVLDFWFVETPKEQWFVKDDALDREIAKRFGTIRDDVMETKAAWWREGPNTMLAAIILLDQFSRNIHRDAAEAFACDPLARELTMEAIGKGWDDTLGHDRCIFLYMPLMHCEDRETQTISVGCFAKLGDPHNLEYAKRHAEVIARFGRFPSRNEALGRESTEEEKAFLSQPGAGW